MDDRQLFLKIARPPPTELPYATCGECFCIPKRGEQCPVEVPRSDFAALIPELQSLTLTNPQLLPCNPYMDSSCDTVPQPMPKQGGACVIDIVADPDGCPSLYSLRTYEGKIQDAKAAGERVTHAGACGVCSPLQDLAVYLSLGDNLTAASLACATQALTDPSQALVCFQQLGFTDGCAAIWLFNALNTGAKCLEICTQCDLLQASANGPPPKCRLNDCVQCDETESGPIFAQFAGRTRRSSGLLSNIVRPCADIVDVEHYSLCEPVPLN